MLKKRTLVLALIVAIMLAAPASALAAKNIFKARLSSGNELHEVTRPGAAGSLVVTHRPEGVAFMISVHSLSGTPTGIHLHGPASATENGPVVVTLCGGPAPSVAGPCPAPDSNGFISFSGNIPGTALQPGVTPGQFLSWLNSDLLYVNVHTALNPAGETRGQLIGQ